MKKLTDVEFDDLTRVLVPFAYGAFEQHGTKLFPFEAGKPNINAYNAMRAVLKKLEEKGLLA